jgi:hypothetical protein
MAGELNSSDNKVLDLVSNSKKDANSIKDESNNNSYINKSSRDGLSEKRD